ncbi:survival of motor neuron-related-splicing factor-like protein [Rhizoctonia solani 123E]|uniref:Survival of motor neuron-related-splicing factor-like protein n=1 Tax=Rhizoctonia solani 123E TaxID=1423351 RepID=A0A074S7T6_9AGAM|nr:survival of motor neuron-related-splicing factor-like protein [Rhizoctonia solani 123E]
MDRKELETYQVQLSQVELALASDPDNEELTSLRSELKELISLTEAALVEDDPAPVASGSAPSAPASNNRKQPVPAGASFQAGDECLAKYSSDGQWYPARITSVGGSDERRVFSIVFKGYNSTELVDASSLKRMPPGGYRGHNATMSKRKLDPEEEIERERKKKKNEKKLEVRAQKAKEQNNKQAAWQKFAKKSEKKGVAIAGVQGNSIFRTPDNPHGRVGVTGSGKGMTEYAAREKHKFTPDEAA